MHPTRKSPPYPAPDADTQLVDLSPVAKNLRDNFELARGDTLKLGEAPEPEATVTKPLTEPCEPEQPEESEPAAAVDAGQDGSEAVDDGQDGSQGGDLFFAEAKDFLTRESQFGEDAPVRTRAAAKGKAKARTKAKAKAKAAGRPKAACKAKAKAKAKSKAAAKPKTKQPRKPKAATEDDDGAWDADDIAGPDAQGELQSKDVQECPEEPVDLETTPTKTRKSKEPRKAKEPGKCMQASKSSKSPKPEVTKKTRKMPPKGQEKASFARRFRPMKDAYAGQRWDQLKGAFGLHVQPKVVKVSYMEAGSLQSPLFSSFLTFIPCQVGFWNYAMEFMKDEKKARQIDGTNLKQVCNKAARNFLTLEWVQSCLTYNICVLEPGLSSTFAMGLQDMFLPC